MPSRKIHQVKSITTWYVLSISDIWDTTVQNPVSTMLSTIRFLSNPDIRKFYQAAMMDPHTSSELNIRDIIRMCDELIEAHGDYMKEYI